ncbi:hypothetical protein RRG08_010208 [Elysia crispata]|uniref:Uncharacterized protein n=1 Tax=Elysia crispata TaxID=231223 RepID=A0AAE1AJD0_9GAST|nr:hypothetical protein RRG08_010208 [Elysia crispata]
MQTILTSAPWLLCLLLLSCLCAGLQFDLDLDPTRQLGSRAACAVLRCASLASSGQGQGRVGLKNISSLTILKTSRLSRHGKYRGGIEVEVASLSSQQPRVTRVFDGIKADGKLDAMRASLTLELFKSSDCLADFMCQLRTVDASGVDSVSSSRVQQSRRRPDEDSFSLNMSPVSLQILGLVHELDSKLSVASYLAKSCAPTLMS